MLSAMGDQNIVQWYQDIAEELPDMAVFVYDDAQAFKRPINTSVYRAGQDPATRRVQIPHPTRRQPMP